LAHLRFVGQRAGGANCDPLAGTNSQGFNFSDDSSCTLTVATDKENAGDPSVGPLADNGGPTHTRLPQAGSPLVDAIPDAHCHDDGAAVITTDQIGTARPQGPACDIGAVEVPTIVTAVSGSGQSTTTGTGFAAPLVVKVTYSSGAPVNGDPVAFTTPDTGASATFASTGTNTETVLTDADGIATTSALTANATPGTYTVTATGSGAVTFILTNAEGPTPGPPPAPVPAGAVAVVGVTPTFTG
jgi:hypothetical protein